jgi:hypothetical protein
MPQYGCTACQRKGQARRLQGGWVAARQRSGHDSLNAETVHRPLVEWTGLIKCGAAHRLLVEWTDGVAYPQ